MEIPSMSKEIIQRLEQIGGLHHTGGGNYRAPCPICAKGSADNALSIKLEGNRALLHCFRCESPYPEMLAALGLDPRDLTRSSDWTPRLQVPLEPDEQQRAKLERVWKASFPLAGSDHASRYLAQRGLTLERYPSNIRYTHLEYRENGASMGVLPVMLARIQNARGELVSLHRTYLDPNGGGKARVSSPKKIMTGIHSGATMGGSVRLSSVTDHLAVTEGIETGLAVQQMTGLYTWAAVSSGGLERLMWPSSVKTLTICADYDPINPKTGKRPGLEAAYTLARRALEGGLLVRLAIPPLEGMDWLDCFLLDQPNLLMGLKWPRILTMRDLPKSVKALEAEKVAAKVAKSKSYRSRALNHFRGVR
jgi:putative DNA primase/helicase